MFISTPSQQQTPQCDRWTLQQRLSKYLNIWIDGKFQNQSPTVPVQRRFLFFCEGMWRIVHSSETPLTLDSYYSQSHLQNEPSEESGGFSDDWMNANVWSDVQPDGAGCQVGPTLKALLWSVQLFAAGGLCKFSSKGLDLTKKENSELAHFFSKLTFYSFFFTIVQFLSLLLDWDDCQFIHMKNREILKWHIKL